MRWRLAILALLLAAGAARAQSRPAPPLPENLAEPFRPGWVVDARNGCWIWNSNPQPGETVTWSGPCPRGPAQGEGQGEWRGQGVSRFAGTLREGRLDGRGTVTWPNGNRYEGEWLDGRQEGRGTYTWANGSRYAGEWRDGRRSGPGTMIFPNGDRYEGAWRDGRRNGRGLYLWANGDRYEGEYRDDRPDGQGDYFIAAEQRWYRGSWIGGCHRGADGARASIARPLSDCP